MKDLLKKLQIVGYVHSFEWNLYWSIGKLVRSGELSFIQLKDHTRYNYTPIEERIKEDRTWSTGTKGIFMKLYSNLILEITCWETDNFDGSLKDKEWEGTIQLDESWLDKFSYKIESNYNRHVEDVYEKELEEIKQKKLKVIYDKLLK